MLRRVFFLIHEASLRLNVCVRIHLFYFFLVKRNWKTSIKLRAYKFIIFLSYWNDWNYYTKKYVYQIWRKLNKCWLSACKHMYTFVTLMFCKIINDIEPCILGAYVVYITRSQSCYGGDPTSLTFSGHLVISNRVSFFLFKCNSETKHINTDIRNVGAIYFCNKFFPVRTCPSPSLSNLQSQITGSFIYSTVLNNNIY